MADEPSAPPPAPTEGVQVAPPSPGKEEAAPAAEGKKPPTKMIVAAVGGVAAVVVVVLLIMGVVSLFTTSYSVPGVSADLGDAKTAAESYVKFRWQKQVSRQVMRAKYEGDDMAYEESLADFYEDKDKYIKENITKAKAQMKFYDKNESKLKKANVRVDNVEGTDERKTAKYAVDYQTMKLKDGKEGLVWDDWELTDVKAGNTGTITLAKIGGKWRIVSADGFLMPAARGRGGDDE